MASLHPALGESLKGVRSVRPRRQPAPAGALVVDPASVVRFRARQQNLHSRLPAGQLTKAASGGLQDSAPRSALLALHARCEGVGPASWEDPGLVQIWFRRADYVVPRRDVGVFTIGALPRDFERRAALDDLADRVVLTLAGKARPAREVAVALGVLSDPSLLRCTSMTGKVHIRWDARTTTIHPAVPAEIDEEEARAELARHYLSWMGPADVASFAKWAGVTIADAEVTWAKIGPELLPVGVNGYAEWILAVDKPALEDGGPLCHGVRLLPLGDPFLWPLGGLEQRLPAEVSASLLAKGIPTRVVNGLGGRVLAEGEVVGAWGRNGGALSIAIWTTCNDELRDTVHAEAISLAAPVGKAIRVRWLPDASRFWRVDR